MRFLRRLLSPHVRFLAALFVTGVSVAALSHATPAHAASILDSRGASSLGSGGVLTSPSGQFQLVMQGDGNLVATQWPKPYWASGKFGSNPTMYMQGDGNLVIYGSNGVIWATNKFDSAGARLVLQDDGNIVVVGYSKGIIWTPNAVSTRLYSDQKLIGNADWTIFSPDRRYRMVMQKDGTAVLYDRTTSIWAKHSKVSNATLEMQSDGNLVLYNSGHTALWATNKFGPTGSYLEGQNDGNFVVYTPARVALWSTRGDTTPDVGGVVNNGGIVGDVYADSSNVPCASPTVDVGVRDGYASNKLVRIRLCALPNLTSTSEESTPGSKYYISGANGRALVNSRVSGAWYNLVASAKSTGAPNMAAASSYRTMAHQTELYNAPHKDPVATPGYSNHQMGLAIDFDFWKNTGSPTYTWLTNNASRYGIKQLPSEVWHWSPNGK